MRRAFALALFVTLFPAQGTLAAEGRAEGLQVHQDHPTWLLSAWTDIWLFHVDAAHLLVPAEHGPRVRLDDDYLPIVTTTWDAGDLHVDTSISPALTRPPRSFA